MFTLRLEGFRPRQPRPHSQLPSASVQYLSVPASCSQHLPRSARHSSTCDLASILPPVTSHASPITNSFRIRTYEKHAPNPFRIRTSKTQDLKPFRMNTYRKTPWGEGVLLLTSYPMRIAVPRSNARRDLSSVLLVPRNEVSDREPRDLSNNLSIARRGFGFTAWWAL